MDKFSKIAIELVLVVGFTVVGFAAIYGVLDEFPGHGLTPRAINFYDYIYFSLVTMSSLGYGDFQPLGLSRLVAGIEVLLGLVLLGVYISRIMSIRQQKLIEEIHATNLISGYDKRISTLRSSRESLSDYRRRLNAGQVPDDMRLELKYKNPFYEALKEVISSANYYVFNKSSGVNIESRSVQARLVSTVWEYERMLAVLRRLTLILNEKFPGWKSADNIDYLRMICNKIDGFIRNHKCDIKNAFSNRDKAIWVNGVRIPDRSFKQLSEVVNGQIAAIKKNIQKIA